MEIDTKFSTKLLEENSQTLTKTDRVFYTIAYKLNNGKWQQSHRGRSPTEVIEKTENDFEGFDSHKKYRIFKYVQNETKIAMIDLELRDEI